MTLGGETAEPLRAVHAAVTAALLPAGETHLYLAVPNHSREFYQLLSRVMPDWELRKERLELFMA